MESLTHRTSAKSKCYHTSVSLGNSKGRLLFMEKRAQGWGWKRARQAQAVSPWIRVRAMKDAEHNEQRGPEQWQQAGSAKIPDHQETIRDKAGLRSSQEVNKPVQIRVSRVCGQPQLQHSSVRGWAQTQRLIERDEQRGSSGNTSLCCEHKWLNLDESPEKMCISVFCIYIKLKATTLLWSQHYGGRALTRTCVQVRHWKHFAALCTSAEKSLNTSPGTQAV